MRKTVLMTVVMLVIGLTGLTGAAWAIDYWEGPPEGTWNRGDPGSTVQHWDFNDPMNYFPDNFVNSYGDPFAEFEPVLGWESILRLLTFIGGLHAYFRLENLGSHRRGRRGFKTGQRILRLL